MGGGGGLHRHDGLDYWQHRDGLAPAARRFGLAQEGQSFAHGAQLFGFASDAGGDAGDRAEQIGQDRHSGGSTVGIHCVFEQDSGAAFGQEAGLDLGHLEMRRDRFAHAHQLTPGFEVLDEVAE